MTQLFEFHEVKDPEHLFGEGCLWCNLCSGKEEGERCRGGSPGVPGLRRVRGLG
uniref:Uncharacterized protein n=1 Tax=Zea mays TaxID=4577 RepID=B6SVB3_MAIZE|nr:hypothetical protein [Zea mays]